MTKNFLDDGVVENQGDCYTTNISLSSELAGQRLTDVTFESLTIKVKKALQKALRVADMIWVIEPNGETAGAGRGAFPCDP